MKAKPFDFNEIVSLLNNSRSVSIDTEPAAGRPGRWALHRGQYKVHTSTIEFEVLYLGSDITHDGIDEASRHFRAGRTHVVYANSLDKPQRRYHEERFGKPADKFWTTKAYLQSFIREELDAYLAKLRQLKPRFYIDPQVTTPAGIKRKIPNPLLGALRSPRFEDETAEGLIVLLGEPGQGKTYMSQYLVSELSESQLIPIYINSAQWESMSLEHLSSLQKTIAHSFRYFEAAIAWVDGQEEQFLRTTLRADLFRIVFDGFDEYILRNEGRVGVSEALDELTNLAKSTGARILITSRSSFWESNVDEAHFVGNTGAAVYRILPFDSQHAKNYFGQRFGQTDRVGKASGIYSMLVAGNPEFVGRGFVLKLVGDLVEQPAETPPLASQPGAAMRWLVEAFCERESLRQQLPLNASEQLRVLETFAAEVAKGAAPDSDALEVCISEVAPHLSSPDRRQCLDRMKPHPLLPKDADQDRWTWSQEQIGNVFLAQWVCEKAGNGHSGQAHLREFLKKQKLTPGEMSDLASMIVDLAEERRGQLTTEAFFKQVVKQILDAARAGTDAVSRDGRTLATTMAMKAVDRYVKAGSSHEERAALLQSVLQGPPLVGLAFTGTIGRMNFSRFIFKDCRFDRVMWANVKLDEGTVFESCHFVGGLAELTTGLGLSTFQNCTWDAEAEAMIRSAQTREGGRQYGSEDLRTDIGRIVSKFVNRSGFLQTVEARNLKRGPIRGSKFADDIIADVSTRLLTHHNISGVTEGGFHVKEDAKDAVRFYVSNGVFTGSLKQVYEALQKRLRLD